ncbi:hypothetical protein M422DRAFT_125823, partial [Sphaerobolus stellatus SS14]
PTGQFVSKGNVCIFPQEPRSLESVLPPPLSTLHDEIAIIFVASPDNPVDIMALEKSPLLVRRGRILQALHWLKENNPLYQDNIIDHDTLNRDYPESGPAPGFATAEVLKDSSATSEGSSYTNYASDANNETFLQNDTFVPLTSTGVLDTDQIDATFKMRKLEALRKLKCGKTSFAKYPSGNQPLKTSFAPHIWGSLWPTLFPYGIGMFEDPVRKI